MRFEWKVAVLLAQCYGGETSTQRDGGVTGTDKEEGTLGVCGTRLKQGVERSTDHS